MQSLRFLAQHLLSALLTGVVVILSLPVLAAESASESQAGLWWNLTIALIVLLFSLASAVLPMAALRQWRGPWRVGAMLPLFVLVIWVGLIVSARMVDSNSHHLWPFEIFAWSMLNMIYMVAAMTAKRIFEKADQESSPST